MAASTRSPGVTRLTIADSNPPVPELDITITSFWVPKTCLAPRTTSSSRAANSGPRWSIIGWLMARTTRSGSGAGPGIRSWG